MRKTIIALTFAAVAIPAAPALADPPPWAPAHGRREHQDRYDRDRENYYDGRHSERDSRRYYRERRLARGDRIWERDGRYYCRRGDGTTGLVVGAALGGILGNSIAGRGDRTLGTILGVAGGGLLGREIDRGNVRCR
jgi:hypothetical protein